MFTCKHGTVLYGRKCINCERDRLRESSENEVCSSIRAEAFEELRGYNKACRTILGNPPVAYIYELACAKDEDGNYCAWKEHLSRFPPCVPEGSVRNLRPLYAIEALDNVT